MIVVGAVVSLLVIVVAAVDTALAIAAVFVWSLFFLLRRRFLLLFLFISSFFLLSLPLFFGGGRLWRGDRQYDNLRSIAMSCSVFGLLLLLSYVFCFALFDFYLIPTLLLDGTDAWSYLLVCRQSFLRVVGLTLVA